MGGPWEKYQKLAQQPQQAAGGPWLKYQQQAAPTQAVPQETLDNLNNQNIRNDATFQNPDNPGLASKAAEAFGDLGKGALKGVLNTATSLSPAINKIPVVGKYLAPQQGIDAANSLKTPTNASQKVGFGAEQIGEWMLPTGLEEKAAQAVAAHAPQAARWAVPAVKAATTAAETGVRNMTQGGDFSTGAQAGLYGAAAAPVLRKAAQGLAGIAMAPGKTLLKSLPEGVNIGKTVLDESRGIRPETISTQLGNKVSDAESKMQNLVSQADDRYTIKAKGLLPPATRTVPLGTTPRPGDMPTALLDAEPFPRRNIVGGSPSAQNVEELGSTASTIPTNPQKGYFKSGSGPVTPGMEPPAIEGPGVLQTRQPLRPAGQPLPTSRESNGLPVNRAFVPPTPQGLYTPHLMNGAPSLAPARNVIGDAIGSAEYRNSKPALKALQDLQDPLTTDLKSGNPIPENVLPSRIRAIKQGIGERVGSWNPEVAKMRSIQAAKEQTYGALDSEFNRAVPGSGELDQKMSNLIPARDAAFNTAFNPGVARSMFNRFARPTGALAGGLYGANEGYKKGGAEGAVAGGLFGLAIPEVIASPEGQMFTARMLASPSTVNAARGAGLQFNRGSLYSARKPY